jgi:fused-like protein
MGSLLQGVLHTTFKMKVLPNTVGSLAVLGEHIVVGGGGGNGGNGGNGGSSGGSGSVVPDKSSLEFIVASVTRLVVEKSHFAKQFIQADGLGVAKRTEFLLPRGSAGVASGDGGVAGGGEGGGSGDLDAGEIVAVDCLQLISHLARTSDQHYTALAEANLLGELYLLTTYRRRAVLRAKVCNLLGNLCRHSASYYPQLLDPRAAAFLQDEGGGRGVGRGGEGGDNLLQAIMVRCADPDSSTRKFACFAVGNASFHSAELYPQLASVVPQLVLLLTDSEEKTRSNAAGALGNLVRNSSSLCHVLVDAAAPQGLIRVATEVR